MEPKRQNFWLTFALPFVFVIGIWLLPCGQYPEYFVSMGSEEHQAQNTDKEVNPPNCTPACNTAIAQHATINNTDHSYQNQNEPGRLYCLWIGVA